MKTTGSIGVPPGSFWRIAIVKFWLLALIQIFAIVAGIAIPIAQSRSTPTYEMELAPVIITLAAEFGLALLTVSIWVLQKKVAGMGEEADGLLWLLYLTAGGLATGVVFPAGFLMNTSVILVMGGMNIYRCVRLISNPNKAQMS